MDARIGFPTEHLVASSVADVNHPRYATAIGLVFKGYQYLREHKEGLSITNIGEDITAEFQPKAAPISEAKPVIKEEVNEPENKDLTKSKFLNSLLNKFTVIFDETDTKM
jgi:cell division protein FtsA